MNNKPMRHVYLLLLIAQSFLMLTGCGFTITAGQIPDLSRLESHLKPNVSTKDDVIQQLGVPYGTCGIFLPLHHGSGDCLYYYREESSLEDTQRLFLFVMFEEGLYSGYMWFSSFPTTDPTSVAKEGINRPKTHPNAVSPFSEVPEEQFILTVK